MDILELRFRPVGTLRWIEAAFLTVWLLFWLVAEILMIGMLIGGALSLLKAQPAGLLMAVPVGGFLLLWLAGWTAGGVLTIHRWLRCFWAEDRLVLTATDLDIHRRIGPWSSRRQLPRASIRRLQLDRRRSSRTTWLVANLEDRQQDLTDLGTLRQRQEASERLQRALIACEEGTVPLNQTDQRIQTDQPGQPDKPREAPALPQQTLSEEPSPALPAAWECEESSFSSALLVPARATRRRQARVMLLLALGVNAGMAVLLLQAGLRPDLLPALLMLAAIALMLGWGALWLALGRREWRLETGELVAQRRFAGRVQELFAARALKLRETSNDDGDRSYLLEATDLRTRSGHAPGVSSELLCRTLENPREPRAMALWLVRRTRISFTDTVPTDTERLDQERAERERLHRQLEGSGPVGRWLATRIDEET